MPYRSYPAICEVDEFKLADCKILTSRDKLANQIAPDSLAAELGVDTGDFSKRLLDSKKIKHLYLVDPWNSGRYGAEKYLYVKTRFKSETTSNKVTIARARSSEFLRSAKEQGLVFDFIYIDTTHTYEQTLEELCLSAEVLSPDGLICGDDFVQGNWGSGFKYGVQEAVFEFIKEFSFQLAFLTLDFHRNPSFALRKISK